MSLIFYLNFIVQAQFFLQIFQVFFIVSTLDVTSYEEDMGGGKLIATMKNMDGDFMTFRIFYSCHFRD